MGTPLEHQARTAGRRQEVGDRCARQTGVGQGPEPHPSGRHVRRLPGDPRRGGPRPGGHRQRSIEQRQVALEDAGTDLEAGQRFPALGVQLGLGALDELLLGLVGPLGQPLQGHGGFVQQQRDLRQPDRSGDALGGTELGVDAIHEREERVGGDLLEQPGRHGSGWPPPRTRPAAPCRRRSAGRATACAPAGRWRCPPPPAGAASRARCACARRPARPRAPRRRGPG